MTRSLRLLTAASFLFTTAAFAQQAPPAGAPPTAPQQRRPIPNPTNLQVLPKEMTGQQVVAIMHKWEGSLGVECNFCHAKDDTTGRLNFASDANPKKNIARTMLRMTMDINQHFLSQLDPKPEEGVSCGTCHRGMSHPPAFVPTPHEHEHPAGPPPAAPPSN